jgi:hypothetical protein
MAVVSKVPVVIRNDYVMYLEWHDNVHWFHTDVFKWTPQVKVKFLEDLNLLSCLVGHPLYAFSLKENTAVNKLIKFGTKLGWKHFKDVKLNNNKEAYIYTWSK